MITLAELTSKLTKEEAKSFIRSYKTFRTEFKSGGVSWCFMDKDFYPLFVKYYQPDIIDENGETLFTSMAKSGKSNNIHALIEAGDDINCKNARGLTPLMLAAMGNYPVVVKRLLDAGADKSIKNNDGKTALELAEMFGAARCAKILAKAE